MPDSAIGLLRVSTTQAIVQHLKRRIELGEFAPGTLLPSERELQRELGVSRLAVREGLARLSALGIIRVRHGKGAFVASSVSPSAIRDVLTPILPRKDLTRLRELFKARALIEGEQAAEAAVRRTKRDLLSLEKILHPPAGILEDGHACGELDLKFHRTVAHIAGNAFLTAMWEALAFHIRSFLTEFTRDPETRLKALERHRPLFDAIAERNPEEARRLARIHLDPCRQHYESRMAASRQERASGNGRGRKGAVRAGRP